MVNKVYLRYIKTYMIQWDLFYKNPEGVITYLIEGTVLGRYSFLYYDWCERTDYFESIKSRYVNLYNAPSIIVKDLDDYCRMLIPIKSYF